MSTSNKKFAAVYQYDPLDRLIAANATQRFYKNTRIATEIDGTVKRSFFEYDAQPLAQQQAGTTTLLATDEQTSVLHSISPAQSAPYTYSPYGHRPVENGLLSVLGFNGERPDPLSGYYLLGQGYRAFNPLLMRFNSPDSFSPFGDGGINAYTYCGGDPINKFDPTGHIPNLWKGIKNIFGRTPSKLKTDIMVPERRMNPVDREMDNITVVLSTIGERNPAFLANETLPTHSKNEILSMHLDDLYLVNKTLASDSKKPFLIPDHRANLIANKGMLEKHAQKTINLLPPPSFESVKNKDYLPSYDEALSTELINIRNNLLRQKT